MDLPCGEGRFTFAVKEMGYMNVLGVDLDQKRVFRGCKLGLPLLAGEIFEILTNEADNGIDMIVSMDFLEHLEKDQVVDYVELVYKKLASGGRFIVRTPCANGPLGASHVFNDFTHKWGATVGVLRAILTAAGFKMCGFLESRRCWWNR